MVSAVIAPPCAYAVEPGKLITDVVIIRGKLYLSDWNDNEIILTKVRPIKAADTAGTEALNTRRCPLLPKTFGMPEKTAPSLISNLCPGFWIWTC